MDSKDIPLKGNQLWFFFCIFFLFCLVDSSWDFFVIALSNSEALITGTLAHLHAQVDTNQLHI